MSDIQSTTGKSKQAPAIIVELGSFAAAVDLETVPPLVIHQAKLSILDTIGCMLIGVETGAAAAIMTVEKSSDPRREATVIGTCERLSIEGAARVNGFHGDIFELNDLIGGHASIGSVSLALAMAEAGQHPGSLLLKAAIAGIETTAKIHAGFRLAPMPYERSGSAYVGFMNTLGAAAVAATFLRLNSEATSNALAVAGALAGWCPAEAIFHDGGSIKPMLFGGWPAAVGLMGARYAQLGVTGPMRLIESEIGFLKVSSQQPRPDAVIAGGEWFLSRPRRKLHACCGFIHPPIDLAVSLRRERGTEIFHGSEIRVSAIPVIMPAVSKSTPPESANQARFHAEYCIALAANGADFILPEHSTRHLDFCRSPDLADIIANVRIVEEPQFKHYQESRIEVVRNGTIIAHIQGDNPRGSPTNPLSDDEVIDKFNRLVSSILGPSRTAEFVDRVMALETEPDCAWIAAELAPVEPLLQ